MTRKRWSRLAAYGALGSLLIGLGITIPVQQASAEPIGATECYPAVLMLRGSGEKPAGVSSSWKKGDTVPPVSYGHGGMNVPGTVPLVITNGYEGPTLSVGLRKFIDRATTDFASNPTGKNPLARLRFVGIDYDAAPVFPEIEEIPASADASERLAGDFKNSTTKINHVLKYTNSINSGAKNIAKFIESDERRGCETEYTVMSYSQGVLSARMAINLTGNETSKIISTYSIGDPFQLADATLPESMSSANTGYDNDGSLRLANKLIVGAPIAYPLLAPAILKTSNAVRLFDEQLAKSDSTIYKVEQGILSRVLCHALDLVCAPSLGAGMESHLSYFTTIPDEEELSGMVNQFTKLSEVTDVEPRVRKFEHTPVVNGSATTYNVAHARPDDICKWDVGSNGSIEKQGPCTTYDVTQSVTATSAKMTVTVTDIFGEIHVFSTENQAINPKVVNDALSVPYNQWIRYESLGDPTKCMAVDQNFDGDTSPGELRTNDCLSSPSKNTSFNGSQVFKRVSASVNGKSVDRYLWGYDESMLVVNYFGHVHENYPWVRGELNYVSWDEYKDVQKADTKLAKIIDGVPYYQFVVIGPESGCIETGLPVTAEGETPHMRECDSSNNNQLFRAVPAGEGYGKLTLESDTVKPSAITGLKKNSLISGNLNISWNPITDNRTDAVKRFSFQYYDSYDKAWVDQENFGGEVMILDNQTRAILTDVPHFVSKVRVRAIDFAGNANAWVSVNI